MKKGTKIAIVLAAMLMVAGLSACGGGEETAPQATQESSAVVSQLNTQEDEALLRHFSFEESGSQEDAYYVFAYYNTGEDKITDLTVPSTYEGKPVTSIGLEAFQGENALVSVTLPDTITRIGTGAFRGCENLKSVTLSPSVTYIGQEAFQRCASLEEINLDNGSLTEIGVRAFAGTNLKDVTLPSTVTTAEQVFSGAPNLERLVLPGSLSSIGSGFVYNAPNLKELVIEDGITSIDSGAFHGCDALKSVTLPDSVTSIGTQIFTDCENVSVTYKGQTYKNVGEDADSEGNQALYLAVNGTALEN